MLFSVHMDAQLVAPLSIFCPWIGVISYKYLLLKHHILTINENRLTMQHITV